MRLNNNESVTSIVKTEMLVLRKEPRVELLFRALPADFDDTTEDELPTPRPPRNGYCKDERGRFIHDERGHPIPSYDTDEADYLKKKKKIAKLQSVRTIVEGMVPDQVTFDADKADLGPASYYRAVLKEMTQLGFGMGDLLAMIQCVGSLSGLTEQDLETAELGFSPAENSDSASSSTGSAEKSGSLEVSGTDSPRMSEQTG